VSLSSKITLLDNALLDTGYKIEETGGCHGALVDACQADETDLEEVEKDIEDYKTFKGKIGWAKKQGAKNPAAYAATVMHKKTGKWPREK